MVQYVNCVMPLPVDGFTRFRLQCWAFSTVEEVETDWIMAGNSMVELSPEQIVQCDTVDQGCNGGDTITAYAYVQSAGLETEAAYPYTYVCCG